MHTVYHAASSPRISGGANSTIETEPVTLSDPMPSPEIIRDAYSADWPGLKVATSCPTIQTVVYNRKDQRRPILSLVKNDRAAPTASPMYTRETKFLVELAPAVELIPNCCWNPSSDGNVDADP